MDINNSYYVQVLKELNSFEVEYVLIGGIAVGIHGYPRYTADMDIWLNPNAHNLAKLFDCLQSLGYSAEDIIEIKNNRDILDPTPIRLYDDDEVFKIDLMTNSLQKAISWQECADNALHYFSDEIKIPVIHINQLILMKETSGRLDNNLKDLVDADKLKKIRDGK